MNTQKRNIFIVSVLIVGVIFALVLAITAQDPNSNIPEERPTFVPASELIPLEAPKEEFKEVAQLSLVVRAESLPQIESVELEKAQIFRSYAPNVFNLQGGPWEVELIPENGEPIRFTVISPVEIEVENERAQEDESGQEVPPFEYVTDTNTTQWDLVLPLYRDESSLNVQTIVLLYNGEEVFKTDVNYDEWRKQSDG